MTSQPEDRLSKTVACHWSCFILSLFSFQRALGWAFAAPYNRRLGYLFRVLLDSFKSAISTGLQTLLLLYFFVNFFVGYFFRISGSAVTKI